jgi:hypothetical protein
VGNMFVGVWRVWNICVRWHGSGGMSGKYVCGCVEGVEHLCRMAWSGGMSGKYVCGCVEGVEHLCRMAWSGGMSGKYVCGCVEGVEHLCSDGREWWDVWEICLWVCGGCGTFMLDGRVAWSGGMSGKYVCGCVEGVEHLC